MKAPRSNTVRIIGGRFRSRLVSFPDADGLRPTPDRARETLFNWLGQDLEGLSCLDAFAGSGALGFEAISRGAARVVMLERHPLALAALRRNAAALPAPDADIQPVDALAYLAAPGERFHVIFLDPPFALDLMPQALARAATRLAPGGKIYAESPRTLAVDGYTILRQGRAGHSHFCLLEPA
ncbi:MAG: 16S rRNA (guanine(966)-N(2))-methyltransferase RsmD [Betaproteobacteria bacterium]|nr:16S rRNA (guanine(966)-N(2))-methyltransferase RsmD [Betaproteobacteria bacterium]